MGNKNKHAKRGRRASSRAPAVGMASSHAAPAVQPTTAGLPVALAAHVPEVAQSGSATPVRRAADRLPLSFPVEDDGWDATEFIRQTAAILRDPQTAIYIDTSFMMWLTRGGDDSRQQFIDWAATFGDRVHVPLWTYHEYYRHHNHDTLRAELADERKKLVDAANRYVALARQYADDPFDRNFSAAAFHRDLDELVGKVNHVTTTAAGWNYAKAAKQVSDWMAQRLCRSKVVFDLMDRLGHLGEARYTQDLPPGYRDRIKEDTEKKGSNRFGDLILWEELLAHVGGTTTVKTVVVLTRDRKDDWFAKANQAEVDDDLRRLTGKARWNPVPAPHPTLVIELRERTQAANLVLLDALYLGATLHHAGAAQHSRLIAYALGIGPKPYIASAAEEVPPQAGRVSNQTLSNRNARAVCAAATISPTQVAPAASVAAIMAQLSGAVPAGEAFVEQFGHEQLPPDFQEAAAFGRQVSDAALQDTMHLSRQMVDKLLRLLQTMPADKAAAVYAGMLASAYYDAAGPREVPRASQLQELFDLMEDDVFDGVLKFFGDGLAAVDSCALFKPSPKPQKLPVRVTFDSLQTQTPLALQQISVGEFNLLTTMGRSLPGNLSQVFSHDTVSIDELLRHMVERYGLPEQLLELQDVSAEDLTTIPPGRGFVGARDFKTLEEAQDVPTDEALNAMDLDNMNPPDDDQLDSQAILSEDSDE